MPKRVAAIVLLLVGALPGAAAQDRIHDWQVDLDTALTVFLPADRSFDLVERDAFTRAIAQLRDSVAILSDEEIAVRLARATALAGNAHTRVYLLRNASYFRRYPVRLWWFGDSLYVVQARPELAHLVGSRVAEIAGRPVNDVAAEVASLYAGNGGWQRYMSTYTLTSPDALLGLRLVQGDGSTTVTVETAGGRRVEQALAPLPLHRHGEPTEAWWDLAPTHPGRDGPWVSALPTDTRRLPLYLRQPEQGYWFEPLLEDKALYFQFNRSGDMASGETVEAFGERLLGAIAERDPERLVVDLRFNTGGNLDVAYPLFERLAALPLAQRPGGLVVITGPATFSAGLFYAAYLAGATQAAFVGEWPGDALDFWAEGGRVVLPHSGLVLKYTNRLHSYSPDPYPAGTPVHVDFAIGGLTPWQSAVTTAEAYFGLRDPALDAALAYRP